MDGLQLLTVQQLDSPSSVASAFFRNEYGVSVAVYGATGDGQTDDTAAIQAALNASSRVFIPEPAVAYRITARLVPKAGQTIRGLGKRSVIRQDTWGEPVFDGIDRADLTVEELHCLSTQPRTWGTSGARGDSAQAIGAAIWSNADRLTVRNLWATGLYCGITLSSWNGTNLTSRKQTGVRIDGLTVDAVDFGILAKGQLNFRANNVCGSFAFATPTTATQPPYPHLVYFSSEGYESEDVVVTNSSAKNGSASTDAYAFQFKGVSGGSASNLSATNCHGLLALFGVKDMGFNQLVSINDLSDGQGAIYMGDALNARNTFSDTTVRMGVDRRAIRIDGSDNKFTGLSLHVSHASAVAGSADIQVYGTRNIIESPKIINSGAGCWSGLIFESGDGHQVRNPYLSKVFRGTMVSNATNAIVEYDPALISAGTGAGANYRSFFTTGTTALVSRPARVARGTGNGGVVQPEAGSHGVLEYTTTGTSGMTVGNPRSEARSLGLTLTVTIINASAGAAGNITWQADYVFRGTAPASPAAGTRISVTFAWDGTAWQEVSRSV